MKKGSGSQKGAGFERQICKTLSLWWTDNENDSVFWRTAASGGRSTQRAKKGFQTAGGAGDLTFTDPDAAPLLKAFTFELKRGYSHIDALDLLDKTGKAPLIIDFWQQACASQEQAGSLFPAVIFQRNRREICIMLPQRAISMFVPILGPFYCRFCLSVQWGREHITIVRLVDFLGYVTPEAIKEISI